MNRTFLKCVVLAGLAIILQILFWFQAGRVLPADYEAEYGRTDAPAYHATPVKRLLRASGVGGVPAGGIVDQRRAVSFLRVIGILAFFQFCRIHFGDRASLWILSIFLVLPPATIYAVRLDSWMDSVSFSLLSLYFISRGGTGQGRRAYAWNFLGGLAAVLALDAKITAALTLIPGWFLFFGERPARRMIWFLAGAAAGIAAAQPGWIVDPSQALAHVNYWQSANASLAALPAAHAATALFAAIPISVWCLAGWGIPSAGPKKPRAAMAILGFVPPIFFTFYRTLDPDGIRHLFLALPFLAVLAGTGWMRLNPAPKILVGGIWLAEMVLREFPSF